jgi:hypothetical protein
MNTSWKPKPAVTAAARPHQTGVAQAKSVAPTAKRPAPPPAYRPQAVPKVLQTKKAGGQQPTPVRPAGRPPPHSPPTANSVQPKMRGGGQHRGGGSVIQRDTTGAFRQESIRVDNNGQGGQNAHIEIVLLDFSGGGRPVRREFKQSHIYPQHGPDSERVLMEAAMIAIAGFNVAPQDLRVTHVQLYTRFNPCNDCTNRMITFKQNLARRARRGADNTVFDVAYTDRVYVAHGQNARDAIFAKKANSTKLRMAGWNVTQDLAAPVMTTRATLGTEADPFVFD